MHRRARSFLPDHPAPFTLAWLPSFTTNEGGEGGGSGDGTGTASGESATGTGTTVEVGPNGFPLNTAWRDMAPEHQAAYWKHQSGVWETRTKTKNTELDTLRPLADQAQALIHASKSDTDKAIDAARQEGIEAGRAAAEAALREKFAPRIVRSVLDGAATAKGLTGAQLAVLAGDPKRFLNAEGDLDDDALGAFLDALPNVTGGAGGAQGGTTQAGTGTTTGGAQGGTGSTTGTGVATGVVNGAQGGTRGAKPTGLEAGRSLWAERNKRATGTGTD